MQLRSYRPDDCEPIAALFYETVHTVNAKDYTKLQLDGWATGTVDLNAWNRSFLEHVTVVAEENGRIVGFGDIDLRGYLDRLYVHKDYQRKGIAAAICDVLETAVSAETITTHASITAKQFFSSRGYRVVKEQQVVRNGVALMNFEMQKQMERNDAFWAVLDALIADNEIVIDRPKGSAHPRFEHLIYPVDYGYLKNTSSMDAGGIDVWMGTDGARQLDALICTVDCMKRDSEIKLLIGCTEQEKQLIYELHNSSRYMKGILIRRQ